MPHKHLSSNRSSIYARAFRNKRGKSVLGYFLMKKQYDVKKFNIYPIEMFEKCKNGLWFFNLIYCLIGNVPYCYLKLTRLIITRFAKPAIACQYPSIMRQRETFDTSVISNETIKYRELTTIKAFIFHGQWMHLKPISPIRMRC